MFKKIYFVRLSDRYTCKLQPKLQQSRFNLVLKIGEKAYAKWALYLNKNYSYCSYKPFFDNAPVDWGMTNQNAVFHECT
jgi:hypothetical protein